MKNDLLLDDNYDLVEGADGDFVEDDADELNQELLLVLPKASLINNPDATVGLESYMMNEDIDGMVRETWKAFSGDGMKVNKIAYDEATTKFDIDAQYTS